MVTELEQVITELFTKYTIKFQWLRLLTSDTEERFTGKVEARLAISGARQAIELFFSCCAQLRRTRQLKGMESKIISSISTKDTIQTNFIDIFLSVIQYFWSPSCILSNFYASRVRSYSISQVFFYFICKVIVSCTGILALT